MLGAFLLGVLTKRTNQRGIMAGMATSLVFMAGVWYTTRLAWTWYVLVGTVVCASVGYVVSIIWKAEEVEAVVVEG
jgi:Na+/proline symporter